MYPSSINSKELETTTVEKDLGIWIADDLLLETSYLALLNIVVQPKQTPGLDGHSIFLLFVQRFVKPVK